MRKNNLLKAIKDPNQIIEKDDKVIILKDKYPKAKHHFLVVTAEGIPDLQSLTRDHIELLKYMEAKGRTLVTTLANLEDLQFRFGYHLVPTQKLLHLHVISQEFHSKHLHRDKHYNSFTTEFFIDSKDLIMQLEKDGEIKVNAIEAEKLLNQQLKCHLCKLPIEGIAKLKFHLLYHKISPERYESYLKRKRNQNNTGEKQSKFFYH